MSSASAAGILHLPDPATLPPPPAKPVIEDENTHAIEYLDVANMPPATPPKTLMLLSNAKTLFQRQLPKMPGEYIARLVFDPSHRSLLIVAAGTVDVLAGIAYRVFPARADEGGRHAICGFVEIVFCAVHSPVQVRGYGARLMNKFKDHVHAAYGMRHFMTYADNYAVGYFRKQGFSKEITLDEAAWRGLIKDYEGGTMMHCALVEKVEYTTIGRVLWEQKQEVLRCVRHVTQAGVVHPGLDPSIFADGPVDPLSIPGISATKWTPDQAPAEQTAGAAGQRHMVRSPLQRRLGHLLEEMNQHPTSWPFQKPVPRDEVPGYYDFIQQPMDLSTLEKNVEEDMYPNLAAFCHHAQLIFDNCRLFNEETSAYVRNGNKLEEFFWDKVKDVEASVWKDAVDGSMRRRQSSTGHMPRDLQRDAVAMAEVKAETAVPATPPTKPRQEFELLPTFTRRAKPPPPGPMDIDRA